MNRVMEYLHNECEVLAQQFSYFDNVLKYNKSVHDDELINVSVPLFFSNSIAHEYLKFLAKGQTNSSQIVEFCNSKITNAETLETMFFLQDYFLDYKLLKLMPEILFKDKLPLAVNFMKLLLVHYGMDHLHTTDFLYKFANALQCDPDLIISMMSSNLTPYQITNHHRVRTQPDNLLIRYDLLWIVTPIKNQLRNQLRLHKILHQCHNFKCLMCNCPGKAKRVAPGSFFYHFAALAPCCGRLIHKSCLDNFRKLIRCKCGTALVDGTPHPEEDYDQYDQERRAFHRSFLGIKLSDTIPNISKVQH